MRMISLYASLLGPAWESLAPAVQRLHACGVRAGGRFRVRRGEGRLARLCAAILGMPPAGEGVGLTLSVDLARGGERWTRVFGARTLRTWQWRRGALLVEAFGLAQCLFRLRAEGGALVFEQVNTRLGLRHLALPLPRALAPRIEGRATPVGDDVQVDVRIHAPLVGLLVAYDGRVTAIDSAPAERDP
jgi:hypothetical protein